MSSAAANPPPSQSSASQATTAPTKPQPHGHPRSSEQPRQRRRLDPDDDETVVATPAAGSGSGSGPSSQVHAALPKDNCDDDIGSVYRVSSDDDDDDDDEDNTPVPSKRSRGSTRLRMKAVRESNAPPSRSRSLGPVSEGPAAPRWSKGSLSRSSVMVCMPKRVTPCKLHASKRPTGSNVPASQKASTHKPAHRSPSAALDVFKRLRDYQRRISAQSHSPRQQSVASGHTPTIPAPASAGRSLLTPPKSQVTSAGSEKPPDDDGSSPVMRFLAGIGLGQSHFQILTQEGIRTQQDLDGLQKMEKDSIVELRDVLRARGFTAFEFSKVEFAISRKKD